MPILRVLGAVSVSVSTNLYFYELEAEKQFVTVRLHIMLICLDRQ